MLEEFIQLQLTSLDVEMKGSEIIQEITENFFHLSFKQLDTFLDFFWLGVEFLGNVDFSGLLIILNFKILLNLLKLFRVTHFIDVSLNVKRINESFFLLHQALIELENFQLNDLVDFSGDCRSVLVAIQHDNFILGILLFQNEIILAFGVITLDAQNTTRRILLACFVKTQKLLGPLVGFTD